MHPGTLAGCLTVVVAVCALASPPLAAADPARRFTAEVDVFALSGEFGGEETTEILYAPLILKGWGARHEFSVVLPFLRVEGPPGVVGGEGTGVPTSEEASGERVARSGPGDLIMRGEFYLVAGDSLRRPWLSVLGRLKFPTASESEGLGTGELDWSAGVSYTQPWGKRIASFVDLTRKQVGDPPGVDFRDTTGVLVGVSARLGEKLSGYLMYDREDSIVRGLEDGESASAGLMFRPRPDWRLSAAVFRGLSDTREDVGGMLGLARTWDVPGRLRP